MHFSDDDVLQMFRELPEHRGSTEEVLNDAETLFGVRFPALYRQMMRLDAVRLTSAGIVAPIHELHRLRDDANEVLIEDGHSFRLFPADVVFAWDDIRAFYFFRSVGDTDTPVMMFNYYSSDDNWEPRIAFNTLTAYFAWHLRRYLNL